MEPRQQTIIDLLWLHLKRVPGHKDRRQTSWGSKTQVGLVACIETIMDPLLKPRVIHIHGRRWFEKTNGNTYHTVVIWVDGEQVHKSERAYGYGSQYEQTAQDWLIDNRYLPDLKRFPSGCSESMFSYCENNGIKYVDEVDDVLRKKDL